MSRTGGLQGMKYIRKSFTNLNSDNDVAVANNMSEKERARLAQEAELASERIKNESATIRKGKTIIPFGDKVLVRKRQVGETAGAYRIILTPDKTREGLTDIADVVAVADLTFADKQMIENGERIIDSIVKKASEGDAEALKALITFNQYLKLKTIKNGDVVMVNKYAGTDFFENNNAKVTLSVVNSEDIIGLVVEHD